MEYPASLAGFVTERSGEQPPAYPSIAYVLGPLIDKIHQYYSSTRFYERGYNFFAYPETILSGITTTISTISLAGISVDYYPSVITGITIISGVSFLIGGSRKFFQSKYRYYSNALADLESMKVKLFDAQSRSDHNAIQTLSSEVIDLLKKY